MSDAFTSVDPEEAREFLAFFEPKASRKGEAHFRAGSVTMLRPIEDGFEATVEAGGHHLVTLSHEPEEGWFGECTCPEAMDCEHVYAAMKTLLAEHNLASVRELSAGVVAPVAGRTAKGSRKKPAPPVAGEFAREVAKACGRRLAPAEIGFLQKLSLVFTRCSGSRTITRWDFEELGLPLGGYGWDALQIWPEFPADEREFWLYLANAALERGRKIPEFLEPITDLTPIRERLRDWHRTQEIRRWTLLLENVEGWSGATGPVACGVCDLRLKLGPKVAVLEWQRPGRTEFEPIKPTQCYQFGEQLREGRMELGPEAERIWHAFQQRVVYGRGVEVRYDEGDANELVGRLLRHDALQSRVVTAAGQPFLRAPEPLRWELQPAATEGEDYRFRLVQSNGQPVPPLLCRFHGHPPLFVTEDTVFTGSFEAPPLLDPTRETAIPAPALETRFGLNLLQGLRLELPPRLRDRVRHVPMQVAIHCELQPTYAGSAIENCVVQAIASAADQSCQEAWNGSHWLSTPPPRGQSRRKPKADEAIIPLYDRSRMSEVPALLEPLGLKMDNYSGQLAVRVTKKFPELFVPWLKSLPPHIVVHLAGDLATLAQEDVSGRVRLDIEEGEIDWFDLRVVLEASDTTLTPEELKLLLNAKGSFVRLKGKGWRRLRFDLTKEDDERLAKLGLNPHELTAEPQRLHALQLAHEAARRFLPEAQVEQLQRRAGEIKARVTPSLPAGITAELRPYQLEGFHFLAYLATNRFGGILADDMGLGKTLQALAWLTWLRESAAPSAPTPDPSPAPAPPPPAAVSAPQPGGPTEKSAALPSLVVCPKSVMDNWHAEAARFAPALRVKLWPASELATFLERREEADLHVLNYNQLRLLGESLVSVMWQAVILDEGQYIKNPSSQTAQIARALRAQHRLVLSGTPIENRLLDLWSLMAFAMPGVLSSRNHFARLYNAKDDPFARRRLAARVRPFLLRRTKNQVAKDLPDRIEEDLCCEIEGEQQMLYRAELKRAQQLLLKIQTQKELAAQQFHLLTSLLRLRQICCHPALVKPESTAESAKVTALMEQLEPLMEEGHKVLVFSQFVELLALLKPMLAARGWPMFYLAGETENRGKLVQDFQTAPGSAVFLISLKAGGFGLNLTAASYVILFDPWWNPAVENQAIDRTHRIGQVNKVIAYRLLIKDSIEEKIRLLQKQKQALAQDVLGEEKFAQSLTLDDLRYLFAD